METATAYAGFPGPLSYILPTLACIFSNLNEKSRSYEGFSVVRANLSDKTAFEIVNRLYITDSFDFFAPPSRNNPTDFLVCPEQVNNVQTIFSYLRIPYEVTQPNLQRSIDLERRLNDEARRLESGMSWTGYQRLATIQNWMDNQAENHPSLVHIETYGASSEKRPLRVMVINTNRGVEPKKPAIWIDGGIHAREWVSPATVTYIANELIQSAVRGDENYELVNSFEWYIMPNLNPDGYEYSHTMDRMWRKTRSGDNKSVFASLFGCVGVDPNRNWDYQWGGKGTSSNPCAQNYRGLKAASEPEVSQTQDFIFQRKDIFQQGLFLTFHSYSQMLFTPWGYDDVPLEDREDLMNVANKAVKTLYSKHGTEYQAGSSPELLYAAAGGSEDWARGVAGIKFSYCYELRDTGRYGFILPPDQIIPSGEETFLAVKSMAEDIKLYYSYSINSTKVN